jgi:HEAT repeat protein
MGFGFDFEPRNFGLGVLAGWASAYVLYQARQTIRSMRQGAGARTTAARAGLSRTAEGRYSRELIQFCESNHLLGSRVALSKILVEPRFLPQTPFASPPDDDVRFDVFRVVPRVHDHPALYAVYNVDFARIADLGYGDRAVALLGNPGSGRTTALQAIALWNMGLVDFTPPKDAVAQQLEDEEKALKADERAARAKDRLSLEERARERLAEELRDQKKDPGLKDQPDPRAGASPLQRLTPVYVHLANVHPTSRAFGRQADPAEPLLRGIQAHLGSVTSKTYPRRFYERLNQGRLLLLIDGYDDLPEAERAQKLPWLAALLGQYRQNFFIVAGPTYGVGGLLSAGLTPVYLRPWDDNDAARAASLYAEHWRAISRRRDEPNAERIARASKGVRGLNTTEICTRIRALYADQYTDEAVPGDWMRGLLDDLGLTGDLLDAATTAAALQLDAGAITEAALNARLAALVSGASPAPTPPALADDESEALFAGKADDFADDLAEAEALFGDAVSQPEAAAQVVAEDTSPPAPAKSRTQSQLVKALVRLGLLSRHSSEREGARYRFRQASVAAYLAGLTLTRATDAEIAAKATLPAWDLALGYAVAHTPLDAAVQARLNAHPDVLYNHIFNTARWLSFAGERRVEWRATVMKQVAGLFAYPAQYTLLRERAAAAVAGTRDLAALGIFQRGLKNQDSQVRRLSALMLGYFQDDSSTEYLAALVNDPVPEVALAAAAALSGVRSEDAYEEMALAFTNGPEPVRQIIAESFAAIPDPGYPTLYEAAHDADLLLRRYAIFGLRRVNTPWALLTVYRTFLEEKQFYVKSAAQQAFLDIQDHAAAAALRAYPQPGTVRWLADAAGGPERLQNPELALVDALTQGGPSLQSLSAQAMGQLGMTARVADLYQALLYRDGPVRDAAHRALAELQIRMGEVLPAPA